MSVGISANEFGNKELVMTVENNGIEEICVPLPLLRFGEEQSPQVVLKLPDGAEKVAFYEGGLHHVVGSLPGFGVSIPMQPKSSFSVRTLLAGWACYAPELRRLEELLKQPSTLHLRIQIRRGQFLQVNDCYGRPRPPNGWPPETFWHGTLLSNTLRFPLAR
jgi:hypothetical protein